VGEQVFTAIQTNELDGRDAAQAGGFGLDRHKATWTTR